MVINPIKVFCNFYDDRNISNYRLLIHGENTLSALLATFPELAEVLRLPLEAYREELGGAITARAVLKGRTATVNDYIDAYLDTVRQLEDTLGARKIRKGNPVYTEFFPQGKKTFNGIDRGSAHSLMELTATAARTHAALLGADLADELQAFPAGWLQVRSAQQTLSGKVKEKGTARSAARKVLELALCRIIHSIGEKYPGDVEKCASFFNFSVLYAPARTKKAAGAEG